MARRPLFVLSALVLATLAGAQGDAAKDIKAKEPEKRLAAVEALRAQGGEAADKALTSALLDKDWEVVEASALALRDVGTKAAVPQLVKTALDAPAARMRRAACEALAKVDAAKATEELAKQTAGKNATRAWEALALVGPNANGAEAELLAKNLKKSQKAKEAPEKLAAAGAIGCVPKAEMLESLEAYLGSDNISHATAALRAVASKPDADSLSRIQAALVRAKLDDVLERRLISATAEIAASVPAASVTPLLDATCGSSDANVAARGMRLAYALAKVAPTKDAALGKIDAGLSHKEADVRAAALHAGGQLKDETTLKKARALAASDAAARVRLIALHELVEQVGVADKDVLALVADRVKNDTDELVREDAAVALAKSNSDDAVVALRDAINDRAWTVAACAAVSLGKTTHSKAVEPLIAMAKDPDWKRRGAAITGLCHVTKNEAVATVLTAIGDPEPAIAKTALIYAKVLSKQDLGTDAKPWIAWWEGGAKKMKMWTAEEARRRREGYGEARTTSEVFKDLDVIVLDSRGDHIQTLLAHEKIPFRTTAAAKVKQDGVHPFAVYISNCTGEIESEDIDHLQWFVRTGGYLFGSCWSLRETIEKVYPGVVKAAPREDVLGNVTAEPIAQDSRYLKGVFDGGVEPHYNLEGPHLIDIVDRERSEVLVDSAECATLYGNGNLAVWFRAGHGLILDSVNHFDNQGLMNATWLKGDEEAQAYALDHMGMSYAEWRSSHDEKWWSSNTKAAEKIFDRTALSLVTNFVRSKRLEEM